MNTLAYNNNYLEDAMQVMGAMLDYAVNSCGQNLEEFYHRFFCSGVARSIWEANPKYMGLSGVEMAYLVASRTGDALPEADAFIDVGSPEYWTGWALAYISWSLKIDYEGLYSKGVSAKSLLERYPALHECDLSKTVSSAREIMRGNTDNPLRRQRRVAGLTQKDLAAISDVPLRVIRSYEQGQRSMDNAGAESVRRLAKALACRMEELL